MRTEPLPSIFPPAPTYARHAVRAGEIHLRLIDLDDPGWDRLAGSLSADEQARASRYRTAALACLYQRGRAALRLVLAYYAGKPPPSLVLEYGEFGKPALRGGTVHFNVSHSANRAIIAVAASPVGVDLEWTGHPGLSIDELVRVVCSESERDCLRHLSEEARKLAFFQLWTQKEAYCKTLGVGLQKTLTDISFGEGVFDAPRRVLDAGAATLHVHPLAGIPQFSASVCSGDEDVSIQWY